MWPMNKRELARAVAVQADVDLRTVTGVLESLQEVVTSVVSKGEPVAISGFAKFVKVDRPARMGRNPATGEQIHIKASKKARITPVKAFKDAVMAPAKAPKLKRGSWPTSDDAVKAAGKVALAAQKATARKASPAKKAAKRSTTKRASSGRRPVAARRSTKKKSTARRR
ncbi:MAG: HU family DNA-binding protein [Acidimicrobiales bacterium]